MAKSIAVLAREDLRENGTDLRKHAIRTGYRRSVELYRELVREHHAALNGDDSPYVLLRIRFVQVQPKKRWSGASMTIAACYLTKEGVVLGADSTSTIGVMDPANTNSTEHHFSFGQKKFEVGEGSTLGMATWGLGSLVDKSHRTLVAEFADRIKATPPATFADAAAEWATFFYQEYDNSIPVSLRVRVRDLIANQSRTEDEDAELNRLQESLTSGFVLAGNVVGDRTPSASKIVVSPEMTSRPMPTPLTVGVAEFWGWQNMIQRLLWGVDGGLFDVIRNSGKWTGSDQELASTLLSKQFGQPIDLPIRDAID